MPRTAETMCVNSFNSVFEWLAPITRPETDVNLLLCGLQRTESIAHMVRDDDCWCFGDYSIPLDSLGGALWTQTQFSVLKVSRRESVAGLN